MAYKLVTQLYGIACAQAVYGGPRGVWLECTQCPTSKRIIGAPGDRNPLDMTNDDVAAVFRKHGWRGNGPAMKNARCPECVRGHRKAA